jgi:hypothetical protein
MLRTRTVTEELKSCHSFLTKSPMQGEIATAPLGDWFFFLRKPSTGVLGYYRPFAPGGLALKR